MVGEVWLILCLFASRLIASGVPEKSVIFRVLSWGGAGWDLYIFLLNKPMIQVEINAPQREEHNDDGPIGT